MMSKSSALYKGRDHNEKATWLEEEEEMMKSKPQLMWREFELEEVTNTSKRLSNWKGPGHDQVHNFWLKHLYSLHGELTRAFNVYQTKFI